MAQSRMAGAAMGLGTDDLADVGEAATLATNKMGMEQGQQASVIVDLAGGKAWGRNDGDPTMTITSDMASDHARRKSRRVEAARYPNEGKPFNYVDDRKLTERELRGLARELY